MKTRLSGVLARPIRAAMHSHPVAFLFWLRWFRYFFSAVAVAGVLSACGQHLTGNEGTHATNASSSTDSTRYWVGTLNGVKLRIPEYYLFPKKIVYSGERHDGLGPASEGATQNSQIDDFGILLRLSDLQPIRTEQDQQDWESAFRKPFFQQTWMMVDFDNIYPVNHNPNPGHYMLPNAGPYDRDSKLQFGLEHFESVQSVENGDKYFFGHVEYFFDLPHLTWIECETHKMRVPPFSLHDYCQHYFYIPELNVVAKAFYTKKDLPRWREFEERVRNVAHTFIVNSSTGK